MAQSSNHLKRLTGFWVRGWGEAFAGLGILLALVRVATEYPPGHYRMFIGASQALWTGGTAYGVPFLGNLFFFSPSCALFFYGPLTWLPEGLGVFLYTAFSAALFVYGAQRLGRQFTSRPARQWFWFLMASQLYSSLAAHKPEVSNTGLLLLSAAWLIEGRRWGWAAFFLAMIGNFKLQPFPAVVLLALVVLVLRPRRWKWIGGLGASVGFWFALPGLFRPWEYLREQHRLWFSSLRAYSAECFHFYDNVFAFVLNNFGWKMSFETSQHISTSLGAACAAVLVGTCVYIYRGDSRTGFARAILLALVLGTTYTVLVSPLQQISAYVLLAPLFLALAAARETNPKRWTPFLIILFLFWSVAYSGLVPLPVREVIRHAVVRVPATAAAGIAVVFWLVRGRRAVS